MEQLIRHRTTVVWFVLVGATLLSWGLSAEHAFDGQAARTVTTICILAVAFIKIRFVGLDFMELRHAPRLLLLIFDAWMVLVFVILVALYIIQS